jgi:hypothetical protein
MHGSRLEYVVPAKAGGCHRGPTLCRPGRTAPCPNYPSPLFSPPIQMHDDQPPQDDLDRRRRLASVNGSGAQDSFVGLAHGGRPCPQPGSNPCASGWCRPGRARQRPSRSMTHGENSGHVHRARGAGEGSGHVLFTTVREPLTPSV